jgi:subtilase family serine protease
MSARAYCGYSAGVAAKGRVLAALCVLSAAVIGVATVVVPAPPAAGARVVRARPLSVASAATSAVGGPSDTNGCLHQFGFRCYRPAQLAHAYDLEPLRAAGVDGRGRTIVIVDSFGSPTIRADLHAFDTMFGLPDPPHFDVLQPVGPVPAFDRTNGDMIGWAIETTLDIEWSHAVAPGANIVLVETPVSETEGVQGFPEIVKAENYVINHGIGDVISQSFGAAEETFPNRDAILHLRSAFLNARRHRVTVVASSGDSGATDFELNGIDHYPSRVTSWPSSDPLVTSVGGTTLQLDEAGNRVAPDTVWHDGGGASGGGVSSVFQRPAYQTRVRPIVDGHRGNPDISMSAAAAGRVIVYETALSSAGLFHYLYGTSVAAPLFAGVVALADQLADHRLGYLNPRLYRLDPRALVDVTHGDNSFGPFTNTDQKTYTVAGYTATPGYDLASGLGTLDAARFVPALAHTTIDKGDDQ